MNRDLRGHGEGGQTRISGNMGKGDRSSEARGEGSLGFRRSLTGLWEGTGRQQWKSLSQRLLWGLAITDSYWEQELGGQTPGAQDSLEDTEVRGRVLGEKGAFWAQGLRC